MPWLRMLFKQKIKVYVYVGQNQNLIADANGMARYRYQAQEDAAEYQTGRGNLTMIPGVEPVELRPPSAPHAARAPKKHQTPVTSVEPAAADDTIPPNTIVIYTDGGASPNPGPAGFGVLMMYGTHSLEIWEYLGKSTNNIAELTAILRALENVKNKDLPILLYSDSKYAIGVLTGTMKANKNQELIAQVREEMRKCRNLQLLKVKAHVGIRHNEHVDRLVALARDTKQSGTRRNS